MTAACDRWDPGFFGRYADRRGRKAAHQRPAPSFGKPAGPRQVQVPLVAVALVA